MPYDRAIHHRRSIRLRGYDDAQAGAYFVIITAQARECLFGTVTADGETMLDDAGRMVQRWWPELNTKLPQVITGQYVVMPNHFHGIVVIVAAPPVGADLCVGPGSRVGLGPCVDPGPRAGAYATSDADMRDVQGQGLNRIRTYIVGNSGYWATDEENPAGVKP